MDQLNTFLNLLSRTEGRDKFLRLIQYATLSKMEENPKGSAAKIYEQMRMTRKLLRFVRSLQYSTKIKEDVPKLLNSLLFLPSLLKYLMGILQNLFTILYFLSDHRVCLSELKVIDPSHREVNYVRSMRFYFLQNLFGVLRNIVEYVTQVMKGKNTAESLQKLKSILFDLVRCFLDCFVALYYWKGKYGAKKAGLIGVITSLMAIAQSLQLI